MAPAQRNLRWWVLIAVLVSTLVSRCYGVRPGGEGVVLSTSGNVIQEDGTTLEEYELRESDPMKAHFVSLGAAAKKLLNKSGYAYGSIVRIAHSDRDKEYGEGPERKAWFPMVILMDVFEEGVGDKGEDITCRYEVALDYQPKTIVAPGVVILDARKLDSDGGIAARLDVLPAVEKGFLEKNRPGITMMFGVIIASGVVKMLRRGVEKMMKKAKQDRDETGEASSTASERSGEARSKGSENHTKKKGGAKQD